MGRRPPSYRASAGRGLRAAVSAPAPALLLVAALVTVGCLGGQTGQDSDSVDTCEERSLPVALHERTSAGFSAEELINELSTPRIGLLRFVERPQTSRLTLAVSDAHRPRVVFWEAPSGSCLARLDMDVSVALQTADGALAETFAATLQAETPTSWTLDQSLPLSEIAGSYNASEFALDAWENPALQVRAELEEGVFAGQLWLSGGDPTPNDNQSPSPALVAEWPAPPE